MSARFRARATGPISGQLYEPIRGGPIDLVRFPVAFRLPAFASWASCTRRGLGPSLPPAYRHPRTAWRTPTGFPCSARMRPDWGWVPLYPGDGGVHTAALNPWPPPAAFQRPVPVIPASRTVPGCAINEASARVHWHSPHAQPSPRLWTPDGTGSLGRSRELRTRPPLAAAVAHVTAGTGLRH